MNRPEIPEAKRSFDGCRGGEGATDSNHIRNYSEAVVSLQVVCRVVLRLRRGIRNTYVQTYIYERNFVGIETGRVIWLLRSGKRKYSTR